MNAILAEEFFINAPMFRGHEGVVGNQYYIKNPADPNSMGLWIVQDSEMLEIAQHDRNYQSNQNKYAANTREGERAKYVFKEVEVQLGDAVYDYYLTFEGSRSGYDCSQPSILNDDWSKEMYAAERENGALIQFHIPKATFEALYELDEKQQVYQKKPFPMKFVQEGISIQTPSGLVVEAPQFSEVWQDGFTVQIAPFRSNEIWSQRVICGKGITDISSQIQDRKGAGSDDMMAFSAAGAEMPVRRNTGNPYDRLFKLFTDFANPQNNYMFSDDEKLAIQDHLDDIRVRKHYCEHNVS